MKSTSTLLSLIFCAGMFTACSVERTAFVNGEKLEWHRKASTALETNAQGNEKTATSTELVAAVNGSVSGVSTSSAPSATDLAAKETDKRTSKSFTHASPKNVVIKADGQTNLSSNNSERGATWSSVSAKPKPGGEKSQLIALILCAVVGGLGVHRFYLGYIWQGVVQLLTLGGCGVWALIDFIRIIMGNLEPKDGGYDKTL